MKKDMNLLLLRILIILTIVTHVTFIVLPNNIPFYPTDASFILPDILWYSVFGILLLSLVGLFFLVRISRVLLSIQISICLVVIYLQGSVVLSPTHNIILQLGCGMYGAIVTLSFLGNLPWKDNIITSHSTGFRKQPRNQ